MTRLILTVILILGVGLAACTTTGGPVDYAPLVKEAEASLVEYAAFRVELESEDLDPVDAANLKLAADFARIAFRALLVRINMHGGGTEVARLESELVRIESGQNPITVDVELDPEFDVRGLATAASVYRIY